MESYYIDLGLYKINDGEGDRRWKPTLLVEQLRSYIQNPEESIGQFNENAARERNETGDQ
jgi:hypothetical protein